MFTKELRKRVMYKDGFDLANKVGWACIVIIMSVWIVSIFFLNYKLFLIWKLVGVPGLAAGFFQVGLVPGFGGYYLSRFSLEKRYEWLHTITEWKENPDFDPVNIVRSLR